MSRSAEPIDALSRGEIRPAAIEINAVGKRFGNIQALTGLTLHIRRGEIYGLLGPNGAGKSTTINLLCGLLQPSEGTVSVAGFNVATDSMAARRALGVVPQELALYTDLTVRQNLKFFARLYGLTKTVAESRITELLARVNLTDRGDSSVGSLSGGMQRRLNIAASLLHRPSVVLMDEPTVGLDPQNRVNILDIVQSISADGVTVLYSTHYMDEVERICSRIGIIDHGRLLVEGSLSELMLKSGGKQILALRGAFRSSVVNARFDLQPGESIVKASTEEIVLNLVRAESRISSLVSQASQFGEVREVAMNRQSLESLFIQLTGRELRE